MNEKSLQEVIYEIENFLGENYSFRRNLLSGKTEVQEIGEGKEPSEWCILTEEVFNSILLKMMKEDVGGKSPKQHTLEIINSEATVAYDPIKEYLKHLPQWDGRNHVAELFNRIPGLTSEQLSWCSTWLRSMVAHWLGLDLMHGNEVTPVLIGRQGCGKTTFAMSLLPPQLRTFYLDHINFANKFDADMALTHNLLVNIDEFANMKGSQQGKLKYTLSRQKVNGRPIFGKTQEDRRRYASFVATTNDEQPLCDPTGSRRFICLKVSDKKMIDNLSPIDYDQLYAQVVYEIRKMHIPYWFTNAEEERIQLVNQPFMKEESYEGMLGSFYRLPTNDEKGEWMSLGQVIENMQEAYPKLKNDHSTRIKIGLTLRQMGCIPKETNKGMKYQLIEMKAA